MIQAQILSQSPPPYDSAISVIQKAKEGAGRKTVLLMEGINVLKLSDIDQAQSIKHIVQTSNSTRNSPMKINKSIPPHPDAQTEQDIDN